MPLQQYTYNRKLYTVDYRLKQFRHIARDGYMDFINFHDDLGDKILSKLIRDGKADWSKLHI